MQAALDARERAHAAMRGQMEKALAEAEAAGRAELLKVKAELQQARHPRPGDREPGRARTATSASSSAPHILTRPASSSLPLPQAHLQLEQKTAFAASLQQKLETATAAAPPAAGGGGASGAGGGGGGGGGGGFSLVQVLLVAALALFVGRLNVGIGGSPPPPPPAKAAASESLPTGLADIVADN